MASQVEWEAAVREKACLNVETAIERRHSMTTGTVIACCARQERGMPKYPRDEIDVGTYGVDGDYHAGPISSHGSSAGKANERQVSIVSKEVYDLLTGVRHRRRAIEPGAFGENMLVEGLGDLSELASGDVLRIGDRVAIRVTDQNKPCSNLDYIDKSVLKACVGKRGIVGTVVSTGKVRPGDEVSIEPGAMGEV